MIFRYLRNYFRYTFAHNAALPLVTYEVQHTDSLYTLLNIGGTYFYHATITSQYKSIPRAIYCQDIAYVNAYLACGSFLSIKQSITAVGMAVEKHINPTTLISNFVINSWQTDVFL